MCRQPPRGSNDGCDLEKDEILDFPISFSAVDWGSSNCGGRGSSNGDSVSDSNEIFVGGGAREAVDTVVGTADLVAPDLI